MVDFPAPLGPEKPEDLAAADGEVHAAHRRLGRLRIGEREPVDADDLGHHACGRTASAVSMSCSPIVPPCHRVRGIKFRPDFPERRESQY